MKVWYQSFTRKDRFRHYIATLEKVVQQAAPPGVSVDLFAVPRDAGHADHQFRYFELVDSRDVISNAVRAQEEGYSAYLIGNILDPALQYAREVTDIPVLGLCDTSIMAACQMGRTYGFVTINEQQSYRLELNAHDSGTGSRFRGIETLGINDYPSIDENYDSAGMKTFVRAFSERVEALSRRGVEVVIPGGGVVMALLAKAGLSRVGSVPVVNGLHALVAFGSVCGAMYDLNGHFTSKRLAYAGPPAEAMRDIRATHAGHLLETPLGMPSV